MYKSDYLEWEKKLLNKLHCFQFENTDKYHKYYKIKKNHVLLTICVKKILIFVFHFFASISFKHFFI